MDGTTTTDAYAHATTMNTSDPNGSSIDRIMAEVLARYCRECAERGSLQPVDDYLAGISGNDRGEVKSALEAVASALVFVEPDEEAGELKPPPIPTAEPAETLAGEPVPRSSSSPATLPERRTAKTASGLKASDLDGPSGTRAFHTDETRKGAPHDGRDTVDFDVGSPVDSANGGSQVPVPESFDDYDIVEELGRGGMGVVYKARERGTQRIVCVKMMLGGQYASPLAKQRFQLEIESAANLDHPNIVPVYRAGEWDGMPYFVMRYVEGESLGDFAHREIDEKPQAAVTMLIKICRAMQFAHSRGILHRDLKPANILVDAEHEPHITDFGLAKRIDDDASFTQTGMVMGTPDYMSPEQAVGSNHLVTVTSDVYSLGSIMFDLLTGQPPFKSATIVETLTRLTKEPPRTPAMLNRRVGRDLETICLKCLEKEPRNRYQSAAELEAELVRFSTGEPILGRPVGTSERVWRWCRRNPRSAVLSGTILLLLVAVSVVSTAMAIQINRQHRRAVAAEHLATERAQAEKQSREMADLKAEEARQAKIEADANSVVATAQSQLALNTVQTLIDKVQKQLEDVPGNQQLKKELLQTAMDGLKQVAERAEGSTSIEATMAAAHMKMSLIFKQLGDTEEAFKQLERCHEIVVKRAEMKPHSDAAKSNVAATFTVLGDMSQDLRRDMDAALNYYREALKLREELHYQPRPGEGALENRAAVKQGLAEGTTRVGVTLFRLGDPAAALEYFQKALALRQELADEHPENAAVLQDLARSYNAVGEMNFRLNDLAQSLEDYQNCLSVRDSLFASQPDNLNFKQELARSSGMFGDVQLRSGNPTDARPRLMRSLALSRELAERDLKNVDWQRDMGLALYRIASLERSLGEAMDEQSHNTECLEIRERLAKQDPENDRRQMELMLILPRCDQHERASAIAEDLLARTSSDNELLLDVARCLAQCAAAVAAENPELHATYAHRAIQAIQQAVQAGYSDYVNVSTDPDLVLLQHNAEYNAIVKAMQPPS